MINKRFFLVIGLLLTIQLVSAQQWRGKWIGLMLDQSDSINVWAGFRKDITVKELPDEAIARIAVDSKYWLYINGELVVFEGGLKRGPNRQDTYYDEVDISRYLKRGKNTIAVKVWYFGKHGFSHNSSGKIGLLFDLQTDKVQLASDGTWVVKRLHEYKHWTDKASNFRLPESNILYDARLADVDWTRVDGQKSKFQKVVVHGESGIAPWNSLVRRPIPLWKDYGLKHFAIQDISRKGDTVRCKLPYNMQFTPFLDIEAEAGLHIPMFTDNYSIYNGSDENIRAAYITRKGRQTYESLGWQNGHYMYFIIPQSVKIHGLMYRETGYHTEFSGSFSCDDPFFNSLWKKANRTLYVTMRDNYMDCPDRERAQWTGDAVLEAQETFYALSPSAHALTKKWLYELVNWQKSDGVLYSPIPTVIWDLELPDQVLASVGYYGLWMYYLHTGDKQTLADLYPGIQRYLKLWEKDSDGLVLARKGGWQWGDWGDNRDILPLYNLWYYLALKGNFLMATELGLKVDAERFEAEMKQIKTSFNTRFWNGSSYRDPAYQGKTDDRIHALAVLADIADQEKYDAILKVFADQEHASPYMEKYVFEAMYKMKEPVLANARHKKRFGPMVNNSYFTTLFEGWGVGKEGFGGGTVNHAWSGGGLTIMSSELCGVKPLEPGYKTFEVAPQIGDIKFATANVSSVKGDISVAIRQSADAFELQIAVPENTKSLFRIPFPKHKGIRVNQQKIEEALKTWNIDYTNAETISLPPGFWTIEIHI